MNIYFYTLGCRVNQYETDAVREMFQSGGHTIVNDSSIADVCIVNTCTVTGEADRKSRQSLRKMARANDDTIVVAMGCAAEMAEGLVDADIVVDRKDRNKVRELVENYIGAKSHKLEHSRPVVTNHDDYHDFGTVISPEGSRAFMKIEDGCDNFCSYCIIPFARGRVASRNEASIIAEAQDLASKGFKEIIVSGIEICSYGKDRGEDINSLLRVIKQISLIGGIERIRLGSLEPSCISDEFAFELSKIEGVCPHFHLSLQSGCDTVLKRMNRKYSTYDYLNVVNRLRNYYPTMQLTTDIICGFPEETEEEFKETLEFVAKAGFNKIHVFPYSIRKGTVAATKNQVPKDIAKNRVNKLINWSTEAEISYANKFIGKKAKVLIESEKIDDNGNKYYLGYNEEYVRCAIYTDDSYSIGSIVEVDVLSQEQALLHCKF
ncbi:MAG: tRNA (N(6)-L-threonylcarbamoyladenosine(37)-C(2))-methylthiotransferase MtaB [Saccharofermentans sp.]|nr:tRNA (N(6)-L-threonylcarbamoyladenosine(37)-C(2))-methylthiotransferase MtaB [Saccharofermentans sp.]